MIERVRMGDDVEEDEDETEAGAGVLDIQNGDAGEKEKV